MEFILNNRKYSIINHELYINFLMVDQYFRKNYSKYEYDIKFDFITPLLNKDKIEFEDILEGTKVLEELMEKEEVNFLNPNFKINQHINGNFQIVYGDIVLNNVNVGEAVPVLIALNELINTKPAISLNQISEEINYFLEKFRSYGHE